MLDHYSQAAGFIHHPSAEIDKNVKVMSYMDLMRDVLKGEPSTTVSIDVDKVEREDGVMRLEMRDDQFKVKPQVVNELLEAIRLSVARKMHKEGGTLFSHVRKAFYAADWDYSNALNACEFIFAMKKGLGLTVSPAQSQAIVAFYSRDGSGEFDYRLILADIVEDAPKLLDFVEAPPTQNKTVNPFVPTVFRPRPNKTFELIRTRVVIALEKKMLFKGGSLRSWLREAFTSWDPLLMGKLSCWQHVQGAFKALGVEITKQEAECILDCFSETKNGEIRYSDLVDAIAPADTSFLYPEVVGLPPASARAPTNVTTATSAFYKKVLRYADQSFGAVQPRDVLYGSFLRFDPAATGKVGLMELKAVAATLKVNLSESSLEDLLSWFDSDGSKSMDYLEFVRQLFGDDVATSTGKGLLLKEQEKGGNIVRGRVYVPMQRNQSSFTSPSSLLPTMASSQNPKMKSLKEARKKLKIKHLLAEKIRLRNKLDSIELQSKALVTQQKVKDGFVLPKKYI